MVGPMGVKSQFSSDLHQIWWEGAFLQLINRSFIRLSIFFILSPPFDPQKGQMGGPMGVKSQCSSDSHQIGREGAFLQVIKGSFMIFLIFLF